MEEAELPPGQRLCVACGLCCNGIWFSQTLISEDEVVPTLALGLTVRPPAADGQRSFSQPCQHHKNGCCSIYGSWRPNVCSSYRCALLIKMEQGAVSFDAALKTVETAKELADAILAEVGHVEGGLVGEAFQHLAHSAPEGNEHGLSPISRLNAGALRVIYLHHFDNPAESPAAAPTSRTGE